MLVGRDEHRFSGSTHIFGWTGKTGFYRKSAENSRLNLEKSELFNRNRLQILLEKTPRFSGPGLTGEPGVHPSSWGTSLYSGLDPALNIFRAGPESFHFEKNPPKNSEPVCFFDMFVRNYSKSINLNIGGGQT